MPRSLPLSASRLRVYIILICYIMYSRRGTGVHICVIHKYYVLYTRRNSICFQVNWFCAAPWYCIIIWLLLFFQIFISDSRPLLRKLERSAITHAHILWRIQWVQSPRFHGSSPLPGSHYDIIKYTNETTYIIALCILLYNITVKLLSKFLTRANGTFYM